MSSIKLIKWKLFKKSKQNKSKQNKSFQKTSIGSNWVVISGSSCKYELQKWASLQLVGSAWFISFAFYRKKSCQNLVEISIVWATNFFYIFIYCNENFRLQVSIYFKDLTWHYSSYFTGHGSNFCLFAATEKLV